MQNDEFGNTLTASSRQNAYIVNVKNKQSEKNLIDLKI